MFLGMELILSDRWEMLMSKLQINKNEEEDLENFFYRTKNLLERKSRLLGHIRFFDRYAECKANPWGLRVQIFPNIRDPSPEFKIRWENVRHKCSEGMMDLLKEQHRKDLSDVNKELEDLFNKSIKLEGLEGFKTRDEARGLYMESFNKNLITSKNKKFEKDLRVFQHGRAYHWNYKNSVVDLKMTRL